MAFDCRVGTSKLVVSLDVVDNGLTAAENISSIREKSNDDADEPATTDFLELE